MTGARMHEQFPSFSPCCFSFSSSYFSYSSSCSLSSSTSRCSGGNGLTLAAGHRRTGGGGEADNGLTMGCNKINFSRGPGRASTSGCNIVQPSDLLS